MIRTYTVKELEDLSGLTRRTIGDYVAKGLLSGPSHRGRGACYSQSDVDVLRVIPRLRVLMKKEFPSLRALRNFLAQLSSRDIHGLARKTNPDAFVLAVRQLRLRILLAAMLPQVPPDQIDMELAVLSPEQIRAVDTGRMQLGSVINMSRLLRSGNDSRSDEEAAIADAARAHRNGHRHTNGHNLGGANSEQSSSENFATNPWLNSTWSVGWLQDRSEAESSARLNGQSELDGQSTSLLSVELNGIGGNSGATTLREPVDRLSDIARRLERLERLLATE